VAYRLEITDKAEADIEGVLIWFREQGATAASQKWLTQLWDTLSTLENRPERCAQAEESQEVGRDVRQLLFGKHRGIYRILFEIQDRSVIILRLWHGARDAITANDL